MGALTYISFLAVAYNFLMFFLDGGWDNPLARRLIYLFACNIVFLAQMGFIQVTAINTLLDILNTAVNDLESRTIRLSDDLTRKLENAKNKYSSKKKVTFEDDL